MPGGISLGGAGFTLYGDNAQLLQVLQQSQAHTQAATAAMAQAHQRLAAAQRARTESAKTGHKDAADAFMREAKIHQQAGSQMLATYNKLISAQNQAKKSSEGLLGTLKGFGPTLATLAGFGAIASGALVVREAFLGVTTAAQELNQAQFSLNARYGEAAPLYAAYAKQLQAISGRSLTESIQAVNNFSAAQKNFGLTTAETEQLLKVAADASAATGISMEDAAHRIAVALTGETEAAEALGFSLQSDYLKALKDVNSEEYKRFNQMGPAQKAQTIMNELMKQGSEYTGAAAERAGDAAGAYDKMTASVTDLAAALGQNANPALVAFASTVAGITGHLAAGAKETAEYDKALSELLKERQVPQWLQILAGIFGSTWAGGKDNPLLEEIVQRNRAADEAVKAEAKRRNDAAAQAKKDKDARDTAARIAADQEKKARAAAVEAENEQYAARKDALEADKEARIQAAEDTRDAALEGIEAEKQASEDLYESRLAKLQNAKEAELDAAEARHDAVIKALEQEKDAVEQASEIERRGIEARRDAALKASEDRQEALEDALDAEVRIRSHARTEEDRALDDQTKSIKRNLDDRHEAVLEAIESEAKAIRSGAEQALRRVDDEGKKIDARHDKSIRQIEARKDRAEKAHKAALRQIEDEGDAAEATHKATLRRLEEEADAAEARHKATDRALDDELRAAEDAHDAMTKGPEGRERAAEIAHDAIMDGLDEELDAAQKLHEAEIDAIEARERAEDDRHRTVIDNLDEELRSQLAYLDASLDAADAQIEAQQRELKLADLRGKLKGAQSTGNAETIAAAERAIQDELLDAQRDTISDQLKARRAAVVEAARLAKNAAEEEHRLIEEAMDDARRLADARLDATEETVKARRDAAEDELDQIKAVTAARRVQVDDELDRIKRSIDARRLANDDQLALIKTTLDARKLAADDELAGIKAVLDTRKQALDDEKAKQDEVFENQKQKADEREQRDKDRLDAQKQRIEDERDTALAALDERKAQEEDDNEEAQRRNEDALTEAKRRIQDQRTAEDEATADRREQIKESGELEREDIKTTAEAAITASKDALDAYNRDYAARKEKADETYENEKRQIKETYDDPETGLIPKLKKAYDETKRWYDERTKEINKAYENEKEQIKDTFDHPEHGLFAKLEDVHKKMVDALKDTKSDWEDGFKKPIIDVTKDTFEEAQRIVDEFRKGLKSSTKIEDRRGDDEGPREGGRDGGGGAGPAPSPKGGQYRPVVDNAFSSSYSSSGGTHKGHPAADIFAARGSAIRAPVSGRMEAATYPSGGNSGWLYGDDGLVYYFAHANNRMKSGNVDAGDEIGEVGNTGNARSTSPHLHFAIAKNASTISARDGSGDRDIDSSYWEGGEGGETGDGGRDKTITGRFARIEGGNLIISLFGQEYTFKLPAITGKGPVGAKNADEEEVEEFIRAAAEKHGIDPDVALRVVDGEGGLEPMAIGKFATGWSFWPLQQHYGGKGYEHYGYKAGQGTQFTKDTGWQPNDPRAWKASVDWALAYAKKHGWSEWYGRSKHGVGEWEGIKGYARGGYIPEPTLLVGRTLGPYAVAGEMAPEWVTPQAPGAGGGMTHTTIEMPVYIGNREVERLWLEGYNLNVQRGRQFAGTVPR